MTEDQKPAVSAVLHISAWMHGCVRAVGQGAAWLIPLCCGVIVIDVLGRGAGPFTSIQLQELAWHLNGALFLMCLGWAYSTSSHVRIEVFSQTFSPRQRAIIEFWGTLLLLIPFAVTVILYALDYVALSYSFDEASASPSGLTHRWIIKSAIPAGFGLLLVAAVGRLCDCLVFLFGTPQQRGAVVHIFADHDPAAAS